MKIPRYWAKEKYISPKNEKGRTEEFIATGWSFDSLEEAKQEALARAKRVMERLHQNEFIDDDGYYLDRPIREEIIDSIEIGQELVAIITRNNYGAIVLNSSNAMFVDVDFPIEKKRAGGLFSLFRKKKPEPEIDVKTQTINKIEAWAKLNPSKSFRLYKTAAGLRLLFTDKLYQPKSSEVSLIMKELGADPLYLQLCQGQDSFRARLTPKPWRCNFKKPPRNFPFLDSEAEAKNREWEARYERKTANYKTCELLSEFGSPANDTSIKATIAYHDEICRIDFSYNLA